MTRKIGTLVVACCAVLVVAPGLLAAEDWSLFRSFGVVAAVPEITGLDSLAPVGVVTLVGFVGYGVRTAFRRFVQRKPD